MIKAKAWYTSEIGNSKEVLVSSLGDSTTIYQQPEWGKAIVESHKGSDYLVFVPVKTNLFDRANKGARLSLLIYKNQGSYKYRIVYSLNSNKKQILKSTACLGMHIFSASNRPFFLNEDSVATDKNKLAKLFSLNDRSSNKTMSSSDNCTAYFLVTTYYINGNVVDRTEQYLFSKCPNGIVDETVLMPAPEPEGGYSDTEVKKEIVISVSDPCLAEAVQGVIFNNKDLADKISQIVSTFSGKNNGIKITVVDGDVRNKEGERKAGQTSNFIGNNTTNTYSATITLNPAYLANSTIEDVATTLIHEFVHAYIQYTGGDELEQNHDQLASNYVTPMALYLNSYFGMSMLEAYSLAWSGMGDSKVMEDAKVLNITHP